MSCSRASSAGSSSLRPRLSSTLRPLSSAGLCEAETMIPAANAPLPARKARAGVGRTPAILDVRAHARGAGGDRRHQHPARAPRVLARRPGRRPARPARGRPPSRGRRRAAAAGRRWRCRGSRRCRRAGPSSGRRRGSRRRGRRGSAPARRSGRAWPRASRSRSPPGAMRRRGSTPAGSRTVTGTAVVPGPSPATSRRAAIRAGSTASSASSVPPTVRSTRSIAGR